MPGRDGKGVPKESTGPRNGKGQGKGNFAKIGKGIGPKKGGKKGPCKQGLLCFMGSCTYALSIIGEQLSIISCD